MPHLIRGALKDYDWGVVDGLAPWLGRSTGAPQAELWFGAHPAAPALVLASDHADPATTPGSATARTLADVVDPADVPLLVKILAAARPLSVQVHPNRELAASVFAAQSAPGADQVYADAEEKTELLLALTPFTAFCGWRDIEDACALLEGVPGAAPAIEALHAGDHRAAVRALLSIADLDGALAALSVTTDRHRDAAVFRTVRSAFPGDRGALLLTLLAVHELRPGDAVYVPAGVPHSYVQGIGVEVMTSSDNVVRLGLTNKAIFVDQAITALSETAQPTVIHQDGTWICPAGEPFALRTLDGVGDVVVDSGSYRVVLALTDGIEVDVNDAVWPVAAGQALIVLAIEPAIHVRSRNSQSRGVVVTSIVEQAGST